MKTQLLIIDPQNDFIGDSKGQPLDGRATLPVQGAEGDMKRLARTIRRAQSKIGDIKVTLDSHRPIDVAHPAMWRDSNGQMPKPFTLILSKDVINGTWAPVIPSWRKLMIAYTQALEAAGKYVLIIWPEHCLIGTWGHNVHVDVMAELLDWERKEIGTVVYVTKGSNPKTEHYGALQAEVPDPDDPSTQLNTDIITSLQDADIIGIAGEASSHCVRATIQQVVDNIGDQHLSKIHIIRDCMSPVAKGPGTPDFPQIAEDFLIQMQKKGLRLTDSDSFLK